MITPTEAMKQAGMTAHTYMHQAISSIDERMGDGYARENPVLLASMIQAQATDFDSYMREVAARMITDSTINISVSIDDIPPVVATLTKEKQQ